MSPRDRVQAALEGVRSHPLRSALAALGIVIGVAATITLAIVMQSLAATLNQQFEGLGARTLTARADTPFEEVLQGRMRHLATSDFDALRRLRAGARITPLLTVAGPYGGAVSYRRRTAVARIYGTTATYSSLHGLYATRGRFLSADDDARQRKVCVIGERTRHDLQLGEHPEGQFVQVLGDWFKVVGVLRERGSLFGISRDDDVLIPFQTALSMVPPDVAPDLAISFDAADDQDLDDVQERSRRALRTAHRLRPGQADDFVVETAEQLRQTFATLSNRLTLGLSIVVGISLVVSGIGILNIMLVSVAERTHEIGILKAIGARDSDILGQFLLEAVLLTLLGCAAGVLLGLGCGYGLVEALPDAPRPAAPWGACLAATISSAVIGLVFGVVPAQRAAALLPIEALRYE